ncbi:iron complex outermembrane receptor protein [Polymorphobacter multimanifer]|uniref:Iron complex outermembrane receptor protein n=1 Tax=Polymorphobacter multimanifer TaxID=1070431 RepID=A0A841LA42_9SPHN|nr:TonB-dependent receptor [Polymorphobacter multimanifer]MBB6229404.1 iron complex outermembrane receptor protein [Polymorphobacter multimanifer]
MSSWNRVSVSALALAMLASVPASAQAQDAQTAEATGPQLGEILVTAQRREANVQDAPLAISAFGATEINAQRTLSFEDLANAATSLSFTALSPLDQEFNIRGITNTRLDSPSADQSIGIFVDDVYVGRSGLFNFDLYDIERVEVVRGPQGVLLGRNVVGGALSIITAAPSFDTGGAFNVSYGAYDELLLRGHVTGGITESLAARVSFQVRQRDGFNQDILHNVDLDDVDSEQLRLQLLFAPKDSDFRARLIFDYTNDKSNGFHSVAIDGPQAGSGPWSAARIAIGNIRGRPLGLRESLPEWPRYAGDSAETPQQLSRTAWGTSLRLDKGLGDVATVSSITGYRWGKAFNVYDQTGIGPDNGFGVISPTLFSFPVNERERIKQFSQEIRVVSERKETGFEWIVGTYYQKDTVNKIDRFWAEVPAPVPTLSGESSWDNEARNRSYAFFGEIGYRFSPALRVVAGLRYANDKKEGTVTGLAVRTGDKFNPNDAVALTPLAATFPQGGGFTTDYGQSWSQWTPQVTAEFKPTDDLLFYATYSTGYKGGGFEDDPANAAAARSGYDPETVDNFEIGAKLELLDNRVRFNIAAFNMRYRNLQVTQTNQDCLCNITDNAADAKIKGVEIEATVALTRWLTLNGSYSVLDTEYVDFIDSLGRDSSGNFLQRTPKWQYSVGANVNTDFFGWKDGLAANVSYNRQGKLFWAPDNIQFENPYGQLNARVSLTPNEGRFTMSVWGRNLTDTVYRTNIIAFFGDEVSRLGAPVTWGVEAGFRF